jgi:hypothetical protein
VKLRKQAPAKAFIIAVTAGLMAVFFGLVRSDPRLEADTAPPSQPAIDYDRFFAPNAPSDAAAEPVPTPRTHTRTRAS